MQGEVIETRGRYRVRLERDEDPLNPRIEYGVACGAVTLHSYHYLDVAEPGPLVDAWERLLWRHRRSTAAEIFERYARIVHGAEVLHDSPYRGPEVIWYLTAAEAYEHGIVDKMAALKAERDQYRAYAEGDVYGWIMEELVHWAAENAAYPDRDTWEQVDSCWGIYGYDYAVSEAKANLNFRTMFEPVPA